MAEFNKWMINHKDAVMLLVDHQSGLFQLVKDIDLPKLRANAAALSKVAHLAKLPTFTTASVPEGPNGPLIPEIHGNNPDAVYIPRTGQINAWDNPKWVEAIEKTGRKTLIIAGTLTSVCMAFPTLRRLAKITWPFRRSTCYVQLYAEPNDPGHCSEVCRPEAALG